MNNKFDRAMGKKMSVLLDETSASTELHNLSFRKEYELETYRGHWMDRVLQSAEPINPHDGLRNFYAREEHISLYGFSVLIEAAVEAIRPFAPLLEVGAGGGYWSYELKRAGVDCHPTDPYPLGSKSQRYKFSKSWCETEQLTALEAIAKYSTRTLLTIWPDYNGAWTGEMIDAYRGDCVIYVGEGNGGCTGDERLHNLLEERFELIETVGLPQFDGIHDRMEIHKRTKRL
jgi:hypothetical protein